MVLFDEKNPRNPINRRISIIVMTKQAEESARQTDMRDAGDDEAPTASTSAAAPAAASPGGTASAGAALPPGTVSAGSPADPKATPTTAAATTAAH